ncbi:hypothetical protein BO70DRAFT_176081 [Aspergillus heteromorphus CBS 117.55]|uniref:Uncharacterized protein n=1 Tax=Aspergillus heteromorphus CBS 117.55 TaxID=1448321 RepID=A0A317UYL0_9EURO|nr:uncharacterized protein BO70DRAFT_176081 [Aspergillus heteromorphus CBS 117.55]PWY66028.1 hypothetical protein BO70DRAFT_176081 [Aspergillus heteromorphus CBS 117.55]
MGVLSTLAPRPGVLRRQGHPPSHPSIQALSSRLPHYLTDPMAAGAKPGGWPYWPGDNWPYQTIRGAEKITASSGFEPLPTHLACPHCLACALLFGACVVSSSGTVVWSLWYLTWTHILLMPKMVGPSRVHLVCHGHPGRTTDVSVPVQHQPSTMVRGSGDQQTSSNACIRPSRLWQQRNHRAASTYLTGKGVHNITIAAYHGSL